MLSSTSAPNGVAFDAAGDLFVASGGVNAMAVDPVASGTIFGQPVTAGVPVGLDTTSAASGVCNPNAVAFDGAGDLFLVNGCGRPVSVLAKASGTVFGQAVVANTLTARRGLTGVGLVFDAAGDLFLSGGASDSISVLPKTGPTTIFGQPFPTANSPAVLAAASRLNRPTGLAVGTRLAATRCPSHEVCVATVPEGLRGTAAARLTTTSGPSKGTAFPGS